MFDFVHGYVQIFAYCFQNVETFSHLWVGVQFTFMYGLINRVIDFNLVDKGIFIIGIDIVVVLHKIIIIKCHCLIGEIHHTQYTSGMNFVKISVHAFCLFFHVVQCFFVMSPVKCIGQFKFKAW